MTSRSNFSITCFIKQKQSNSQHSRFPRFSPLHSHGFPYRDSHENLSSNNRGRVLWWKRKETHTNHEVPNHWTVPLFQFAFLKETILTPLSADDCRSPLLLQDRHPRRPRCRCPRLRRRGLCQDLQPAQTCTFCTAPPIPLEAVQALWDLQIQPLLRQQVSLREVRRRRQWVRVGPDSSPSSCGTMILDALFKVKNEQDPTLVFRRYAFLDSSSFLVPAVRVFAVLAPWTSMARTVSPASPRSRRTTRPPPFVLFLTCTSSEISSPVRRPCPDPSA